MFVQDLVSRVLWLWYKANENALVTQSLQKIQSHAAAKHIITWTSLYKPY